MPPPPPEFIRTYHSLVERDLLELGSKNLQLRAVEIIRAISCGEINIRWQVGTTDLPPHCLGHIGYEVFSWKRNKGYASEALRQVLPEAIKLGMPFVELTTDVDNLPSQKVIRNNGGVLHEKFVKPAVHGGTDGLRIRIYL